MPAFRFRAATAAGELRTGLMEATTVEDALARVRRQGLIPIEAALTRAPSGGAKLVGRVDGATRLAVANALGELSVLIGAGLSLDRALAVSVANAERPALKAALGAIHKAVKEGAPLSRAMAAAPALFPPMAQAMAEAGEANGKLDTALARLAETLDRAEALRRTITSALVYPCLLLALACGVIGMMLLFVVPQFETLFSDQAARLPFATKVVVAASHAARDLGWAALLALAAAAIGLRQLLRRPAARATADRLLLQVPGVGPLVRQAETARFARVLGSLVEGGVPLPTALSIAQRSIGNQVMSHAVGRVAAGLKQGAGLSGPLAATRVFPPIAMSFLRTGEETARLGLMLDRLADVLDREVRTAVARLIAILTPSVTIVMGAIVAGVIASVMSAILGFNDLALPS